MGKPWIGVQLVADPCSGTTPGPETIARALARALDLAAIDAVIVRPSPDPDLARAQVRAIRDTGVQAILWFPVLSDCVGVPRGALTVNADGSRGHGRSGAWAGLAGGDESFLFSCPNDTAYLRSVRAALESRLDQLDVQGVMLDKIRFPSPANGIEALWCCFCDSCRAALLAATGIPLDTLRRGAENLLVSLRSRGPDALGSDGKSPAAFWDGPRARELAAFRARSVRAVVADLAELASARSLAVGLDLFTPSLASLVGQDYAALSGLSDWIKPMTYRLALGPAGLPLEVSCLWTGLEQVGPKGEAGAWRSRLERILGWELPAGAGDLLAHGLPATVIRSELERIRSMPLPPSAKVFAGIEAVDIPALGTRVAPRDLEAGIEAARDRSDGIVASWDLLNMPEDNLRVIGSATR